MTGYSTKARRTPARRLQYVAWIDVGDGAALLDCHVQDISDMGATLIVAPRTDVPDSFILVLARNVGFGRRCQVLQRCGQQIGVAFRSAVARSTTRDSQPAFVTTAIEELDC